MAMFAVVLVVVVAASASALSPSLPGLRGQMTDGTRAGEQEQMPPGGPRARPGRASVRYCAFMQQDWAGHSIHTHTQISDEAEERGPKVKMHLGRSVQVV